MRKSIFIFLLASLCAGAQQTEWITPFATLEFKSDKVHYYYMDTPCETGLIPIFIPGDILLPIQHFDGRFSHEVIAFWKPIIREEAEGTNFMGLSRDEKMKFLNAFTLQSIWGINQRVKMPSQDAWLLVEGLSDDMDKEIARNAKIASELYVLIKQGIAERNKPRKQAY